MEILLTSGLCLLNSTISRASLCPPMLMPSRVLPKEAFALVQRVMMSGPWRFLIWEAKYAMFPSFWASPWDKTTRWVGSG